MFFWKEDRKLLKDMYNTLIRVDERQMLVKEKLEKDIPDKHYCTKTLWKQRLVNVVIIIMIGAVAYDPNIAKVIVKGVLKFVGLL